MVVSNPIPEQLEPKGGRPAKNFFRVNLLFKERLYEDVWFSPTKWAVMFEQAQ